MKRIKSRSLTLTLVLALLLSLTACAQAPSAAPTATAVPSSASAPAVTATPEPTLAPTPEPTPVPTPELTPATEVLYESMGLKLYVPVELEPLMEIKTGEEPLFSLSELESMRAAQKLHPDWADGAGWLFGISRATEEQLHDMLCYYMFGQSVFARDDEGWYYLLDTPTDVRIEREGEFTQSDMDQWSAFYKWINGSVCERFIAENGLTPCRISNTDVDVVLARIAWMGQTDYSITGLADGEHGPGNNAGASYAEEILSSAYFEYVDEECPDGEYLVLEFPESGARFDFFYLGGGRYVRQTQYGYDTVFRCATDTDVTGLVEQWYDALA